MPGQSGGHGGSSDKVTLEDVVFRFMLDLSVSASKIRTSIDIDYQKNVDNYYYQVMTLWSIVADYIDQSYKDQRKTLVKLAKTKYESIKKSSEGEDKSVLLKNKRDQVVALTFSVASGTLQLMSECLAKKGILRERTASAIAGEKRLTEGDDSDMEEELNAEGPLPEPELPEEPQ
jgi:hypothetical protein